MTAQPIPREEWVQMGDRCRSPGGHTGTVIRVRPRVYIPMAVVQWDHTTLVTRSAINHLTKIEEEEPKWD